MNDQFTNTTNGDEENIARKLNQVAEQTQVNAQFATELEQKLRDAHPPRAGWFAAFAQISPTLRWVGLMVLLAVILSWSIKTLIPAPQPVLNATQIPSDLTTPTSAPDALPAESATPASEAGGYDFRGAKLFLQQPLPDSPDKVHVYQMNKAVPATEEQARALAERFGIQGELYTTPGFIYDTTDYLISDGKQSLQVHSDQYFTYTADLARHNGSFQEPSNPNAEEVIREFLHVRGFDFPFHAYASEFFGGYGVQPLAPDSIPMQYESFTLPMMRVVLDENGQVLTVDASLMEYDPNPIGEYGVITAQEAFERLLNDYAVTGKIGFSHAPTNMPKEWYRTLPDNQPVTIYGYVISSPAVDPGKPYLILIDGVAATGNINGMESLDRSSFIKATGQFSIENGIRKFNVEAWDRQVNETWISGLLSRQGDQVIISSDDGTEKRYPLIDPPADLPVGSQPPGSSLGISGVIENNALSWDYIQFFESNSGGGGGGSGGAIGFYKLNLSGTPVLFPSPIPQPGANGGTYVVTENDTLASIALNSGISVEALMQANGITENQVFTGQTLVIPNQQQANNQFTGIYTVQEGDTLIALAQNFGTTVDDLMQLNTLADASIFIGQNLVVPIPEPVEQPVEDLRGYLSVRIHKKSDGTSSKEYELDVTQENGSTIYPMEGSLLSELDSYAALPILITGTINTEGRLVVDSYKIPYPDLHFQILKGTQRAGQVEGQSVILFTAEDGISYVEFLATNTFPLTSDSFTGNLGDVIQQEVLIIPDETFGGMPVAHVYQSAMIQENGPELEVQANTIYVYEDANEGLPGDITPPNLIIDQVELVYYATNPYYQVNDPNYSQRSPYIQPVWHFHGRYEDGSEYDMLIQALKEEFLLPELAPGLSPG